MKYSDESDIPKTGFLKKLVSPLKWLYLRVKPAELEYVRRELRVRDDQLEYTFTYCLKRSPWSLWLRRSDIRIPVGNGVDVLDVEMLMPAGDGAERLRVRELRAPIRKVMLPHWANIKDGEEIQVTVLKPIDSSDIIRHTKLSTSPDKKELLLENLHAYPVKDHEILLPITEPHLVAEIRIEKKGGDVSANRLIIVQAQVLHTMKVSELADTFPDGVSRDAVLGVPKRQVTSHMKVRLDFEPKEKIKVVFLFKG